MATQEIKVSLREIIIKDTATGREYCVKTVRSAQEIAEYLEETEQEAIQDAISQAVSEALDD